MGGALTGDREVRPYGTWPSPLGIEDLVVGASAVGEVRVDADDIWWTESRPDAGGRIALVRRRVDGSSSTVVAPPWNVRTGVYEYGGGAWCVESGVVVFSHFDDQRLYKVIADVPDGEPEPVALTPEPASPRGLRYGDLVALDHGWVVCVRETHPSGGAEAGHDLVAVPTDGSAADDPERIVVLASGTDFVGSPAVGAGRLAWLTWDHPRMPWDGTTLWAAVLGRSATGVPTLKGDPVVLAGGPEESIVQPAWGGDGALWWSSDRSGWWNLHRSFDPLAGADADVEVVAPVEAELGGPRWVGGQRWFAVLGDGRVLASASADGSTGVVLVDPEAREAPPLPIGLELGATPVTTVSQVVAGPGQTQAVVVVASGTAESTPLLLDVPPSASAPPTDGGRGRRAVPSGPEDGPLLWSRRHGDPATGDPGALTLTGRGLRAARPLPLDGDGVARPEPFTFASADGRTAHAHLYRPTSPTSVGPEGELPPLVVEIHGGPTAAARPMLDLRTQLWTSRGFAVVDVDYGGSTGYGRPYRRLLDGAWGVVDVEDCIAAARHLAAEGVVDGSRMVIRGGSAGGLTTLLALCTSDVFAAGTSLYGVTDLGALAADTHKFESRYLDGLVGEWPADEAVYAERSPINLLDGLGTPVLVLQGADDMVVPPSQAEAVVAAVAAKGLPHAYLLFEGEGHGFRQADTIVRAFSAELAFYGQVLGFTPADDLPPLPETATPTS